MYLFVGIQFWDHRAEILSSKNWVRNVERVLSKGTEHALIVKVVVKVLPLKRTHIELGESGYWNAYSWLAHCKEKLGLWLLLRRCCRNCLHCETKRRNGVIKTKTKGGMHESHISVLGGFLKNDPTLANTIQNRNNLIRTSTKSMLIHNVWRKSNNIKLPKYRNGFHTVKESIHHFSWTPDFLF